MAFGFGKDLAWFFVVVMATAMIAVSLPVATAGRLTIRNEISGATGRDGILSVKCWSRDDKLGLYEIFPGQSQSWKFKTVDYWPFAYTEFRCEFATAFGRTKDDNVVVYEAVREFMIECDKPAQEECVWVAKRDGLYQRKMVVWFGERHYNDVFVGRWIWGW